MGEGDGGCATHSIVGENPDQKLCAWCRMPFGKQSNPDDKYCTKNSFKLAKTSKQNSTRKPNQQNQTGKSIQQNPTANTSEQSQAAEAVSSPRLLRRRNSLNSVAFFQPMTPQSTASNKNPVNGEKRKEHSPGVPAQESKKGKSDISTLLSTLSQANLSSLSKPDLITYLNSCVSCMSEMDNSVHLKKISDLEKTVDDLKSEIVSIKVAFADRALASFKKSQTPSYADSVRGSVLVASFADGEKPADPINVASLEKLIDTQSNGLVPQSVREKDNNVYIRFNDSADVAKAASVFKHQADCSRMFKTVSPLEIYFPVVALFVDVSDLAALSRKLNIVIPCLKARSIWWRSYTPNQTRKSAMWS